MPKILAEYSPETMPFRMRCTEDGCTYKARPSYQLTETSARYMAQNHTSHDGHHTIVEDLREDQP